MIKHSQYYHSYLLRCWIETDPVSDVVVWRFSLQDIDDGQRRGFANLTELVIALQDELVGCLPEQRTELSPEQ